MWYPSAGWTSSGSACTQIPHHQQPVPLFRYQAELLLVVQPALGYHITNSQSRYVTPTRLKSAQYSLHNNAPSSRKLLKMDVLTSETCWAVNWHNKANVIELVYLYSNIKMMHGPIRIRTLDTFFQLFFSLWHIELQLILYNLGFCFVSVWSNEHNLMWDA